jgi:hypothetical protein
MIWTIIFCSTINVAISAILLDFRVTPSVIKSLETTNVTIQCLVNEIPQFYGNQPRGYFYNERGERVLQQNGRSDEDKSGLAFIRIVKHFQSQWQDVAQISSVAPTVAHKLDESVSETDGVISDDPTRRSFLQVSWDFATSDAFGSYRCDAISSDSEENSIIATSQLSFGSSLDALDLLRLLQHNTTDGGETINQQSQDPKSGRNLTEQLESELQKLQNRTEQLEFELQKLQNRTEQLESELQKLQHKTENKQIELEKKFSQQTNLSCAELKTIENKTDDLESEKINKTVVSDNGLGSGVVRLWPRGTYGLLQPQSGCPVDGVTTWESGWVRYHTESLDGNIDQVSEGSHLKQPVLEMKNRQHFLTQHFCMKNSSSYLGPNWPNGSYCISKKRDCPDNFDVGYVTWDEEDTNYNARSNGSLPDNQHSANVNFLYCCRQDGPADVSIYLPNSDPFYLYRYGGKCQQVHDMSVTEEFVVFDTENTGNHDKFGTVHPDGNINNLRLELCYYRSV